MSTTEPFADTPPEELVQVADSCPITQWDEDRLQELYQVSARIGASGHTCTALTRLDPRTRQLTVEELGCYQAVAATRRTALQSLRYAIETALAELQQEQPGRLM